MVGSDAYRVSRDIPTTLGVLCVAGAEIALNVEHGAGAAGRDNGGDQIEGVAVGIVSTCKEIEAEQQSIY
jgi:hypothetical protein